MKKLYIVLLFSLSLLPYSRTSGQITTAVIKGRILDESKQPVSGATVTVINASSNLSVVTVSTDNEGQFSVNRPSFKSYLKVTHIGYTAITITSYRSDTLVVVLKADSRQLSEVVITGQKPFLEQQFDKLIVNVNGDPKAGLNSIDVLKKVPGIVVKNDNEIALEGKPVTVMIDGKQTRLSGQDLISLLNSTSTANINQVEIIHNPSAKYDAEGNGGVINIKTIKRSKPGYDANIRLTAGHGWKYFYGNSVSGGINYRSGKDNLFATYGSDFGKQYQEVQTNTRLLDNNQRLADSTTYRTPNFNQNFRLGLDHYFNKNNILGFLVTGYDNHSDPSLYSVTGVFQSDKPDRDSSKISTNDGKRTSKGINLNLNYKVVIDSASSKEISTDMDGGFFKYNNLNPLTFTTLSGTGAAVLDNQTADQVNRSLSHIFSLKSDYTQKLGKGTLEAGIKASYVHVNNNFESQTDEQSSSSFNQSNTFIYKEGILAAYGSYKETFKQLTIQGGLRGEETLTNGNSIEIDSTVKRNYISLFPNLITSLKLKKDILSFSYSRRIGRPAYSYLNPFVITKNAYMIVSGNPYLKPSFTNNFRLAYTIKSKFYLSGSYSYSKDVITDLRLIDDSTKITTSLKSNLSNSKIGTLNISYFDNPFSFLQVGYSLGLTHNDFRFFYLQSPIHISQNTGTLSLDNTFQLPKNFWVEIYFYGQTKTSYGTDRIAPFSTTNINAGKSILNGKGNLSLALNDIFFTGVTRTTGQYGNVDYQVKSKYDSRNIRLSFSYRFGKTSGNTRKHSSGSEYEQGRTQ